MEIIAAAGAGHIQNFARRIESRNAPEREALPRKFREGNAAGRNLGFFKRTEPLHDKTGRRERCRKPFGELPVSLLHRLLRRERCAPKQGAPQIFRHQAVADRL